MPDADKPRDTSGWGKAGAYLGLAFVTPISGYICYVVGQWLDGRSGTDWMGTAGLIVGCVAGMYETVKQAIRIEGLNKKK
jgi:hypothetical protein